ncbi:MAG: hypothetical protein ACO35E_06410 [Ilumatobacteraceae bacterium]
MTVAGPATPDDILLALLDEREIWRLIRAATTAPEMLAAIFRSAGARRRADIAAHANADSALLARAAADPLCDVRRTVATRPDAPPDVLAGLRDDRSKYVRYAVAGNPGTRRADLDQMVGDRESMVRRRLVTADVSRSTIDQLSRDRSTHIRSLVATCCELDPVLAERLAADRDPTVRSSVAARHLQPTLMIRLAGDPHPAVARAVAEQESAPLDAILVAAMHASDDVRRAVATTHGRHLEVCEVLWSDPEPRVRDAIARLTPDEGIAGRMIGDDDPGVRLTLARRPDLPEAHLLTLAGDRSVRVVEAVMRHPQCPTSAILDGLASNWRTVRWACRELLHDRGIAADPTGPVDLATASLADLLWWADTVVDPARLAAALRDPDLPEVVALAILGRSDPDERVLLEGLFSTRSRVRRKVASIASTPERMLRTLAGDPSPGVRTAVATHAATPDDVLRRLARDPRRSVGTAAAAALAERRAEARWRQRISRRTHWTTR